MSRRGLWSSEELQAQTEQNPMRRTFFFVPFFFSISPVLPRNDPFVWSSLNSVCVKGVNSHFYRSLDRASRVHGPLYLRLKPIVWTVRNFRVVKESFGACSGGLDTFLDISGSCLDKSESCMFLRGCRCMKWSTFKS
ncbi:hypothetical protein XENORESO_003870 [Xenotaenia resolanae]|uniref:Uncharacterized protein n=1 Tax=Xenotaenia resolanae TaxID=208358 RepID=A0ABV0X2F3_9TELE